MMVSEAIFVEIELSVRFLRMNAKFGMFVALLGWCQSLGKVGQGVWPGSFHHSRKKSYYVGHNFVGTVNSYVGGQRPHVALQSQLGVCPEQRSRADFDHSSRSNIARPSPCRTLADTSDQVSFQKVSMNMSRILSIFLLLVVLGVGLGFYRGWFRLSTSELRNNERAIMESSNDELDVHFRVDKDKMKQDADAVQQNTKDLFGNEKSDRSLP